MGFKISNDAIYKCLFFISVAVPYLNNYELTFFTWLFIFFYTLVNKYSLTILKLIIPFIIVLLIAIFSSINEKFNLFLKIRDITYMAKPIIGFLIGYQLLKKIEDKAIFKTILKTGLIIAIVHIGLIINAIFIEGARTIANIRLYSGYFSDFEIYCLVFLLFYKELNINLNKKEYYVYLTIFLFSTIFYLARTNFIQFLVLYLGLKGLLVLNRKSITLFLTLFALSLISYSAILAYNPKRAAEGFEGFLYKIKVAPMEPFKTFVNRHNWVEFNDNYRSYENILTVRKITSNDKKTLFFGEGIGSQIDLKQKVYLGDGYLKRISILHNGFMIVLLKSGFVGLFIYTLTLIYFFRNPKSKNNQIKLINRLFIATGLFLFISNWVFLGFYNLTESKSILLGFLISYRLYLLKNEAHLIHPSVS